MALGKGVGLAASSAGELGGNRRRAAGRELLREQVDGPPQEGGIDARGGSCDARHDDGDFSPPEVVFTRGPLRKLPKGAAIDGLVRLGELSGDHRRTIAAKLRGKIGEGRGNAVRRLEENQRAWLVGEAGEMCAPLTLARREKALEAESADGQPGDGQCGGDRGRAGYGLDVHAGIARGPNQLEARVRQQRRAGVAHECDGFSGREPRQDLRHTLCFIVRMERQQRSRDAERLQQRTAVTRVFGGNRIRALERLPGARADITHVADRRRDDLQPAAWLAHNIPHLCRTRGRTAWLSRKGFTSMHARWTVSVAALAAVILILAGCVAVPRGPAPTAAQAAALARQGNPLGAAQMYEALANGSGGAARNDFALQAARAYLAARRPDDAARALDLLSPPLSGSAAFDRSLIEVRLALQRSQVPHAWTLIQAIAMPQQADAATRYLRLKQQVAFAAGHPTAAVESEMELEHWLLNAAAVEQSRVSLLHALRDAAERGLRIAPGTGASRVVRGWLALAPLAAEAAHNPTVATADLAAWLSRYPDHPAVEAVRSELLGEQPQPLAAQAHIALLLPITGPTGPLAVSVRDGFLTAYYQTPVQQRPVVRIYDTGGAQSIADIIGTATQAGADMIVGPLTRQAVASAAEDHAPRPPLLALNFLADGTQAPPLFFQFALSPVEEAKLVARRVLSDGHRLGIAIVPAGELGARELAAFTEQLQSGGGTLLASTMIDPAEADYSDPLKQVLGIDESRARLDKLEALLGTHLHFVPRRREDIQFIFSPAPAGIERLLQSQLRFYYAGGIATYATSDAFDPDPRANEDLDGLMFPSMPWLLGSPLAEAVQSAAAQAWPAGGPELGRLFAFGFDAYRIAEALRQNSAPSSLDINGLTGQLTLDPDGRIRRQLTWVQLNEGEVTELPSSPGS